MKALLTSTGFENFNFGELFLNNMEKKPEDLRVMFITVAAITEEQKSYIPKCREDLTMIGIKEENIIEYNFESKLPMIWWIGFDAIYVCGGDEHHLMEVINESNEEDRLYNAVKTGVFYIGVSAGSCICGTSVKNGLRFIEADIVPHAGVGSACGEVDPDEKIIYITDSQAIWIHDNIKEIIM